MLRVYLGLVALIVASGSYGIERSAPSSTPELHIHEIHARDSIDVTLSPANRGITRIWRPGNSWGATNWRVLVVRGANLILFREDPDQRFSRNSPLFDELQEPKTIPLNLNSELWIGPKAEFGAFHSGDKVIVVYDVPVTGEARQFGVWYGTISAMVPVN
jgi:hypothetical protein